MSGLYASYPALPSGGITTYASFASFPASASDGAVAIALDTDILYAFNSGSSSWIVIGGPGAALGIGTIDSQVASANGAVIHLDQLIMQSASATVPGLINNTTQSFSGNKTFTGSISASNLSGTNTGDVTLGTANGLSLASQALSLGLSSTSTTGALSSTDWNTFNGKQAALTFGNLTDVGTDGITITGGAGAVIGSGASVSQHVADATHNGYLSSIDWSTFNSKQAAGNYITALTGDVTASGPGSVAASIAKIQGTAVSGTTGTTNVVFSSAPTMSNPVVGTQGQGDNSTKAASTAYVDVAIANAVAGVNPAVAVQAATTAAGNTSGLTYNNGVSGIGATLTGAVNTALIVDGYTFTALGQRLLVKDDTQSPSGAFNGIYYVTQIQTAILPLILTRALDYDMPSDINNTGAIPVINGTVNGTTSWVNTSLVNTVGTDPLSFTKFTRNPADYLLVANNLSDVASKATSFNNVSPVTSTGDLIIGNGVNSNTRIAKGTQYQSLQAGATTLAYDAIHLDQSAAVTGSLGVSNGGTGVASVTTSPAVTAFAGWDANKNLSANNFLQGFTSTATAAGTTTLTVASAEQQTFTGVTTQTVVLPVATTLVNGLRYIITNLSTGVVTVQTSGSNVIQAMAANTQLILTCINTSGGTGTASWGWVYLSSQNSAATNAAVGASYGDQSGGAIGTSLTVYTYATKIFDTDNAYSSGTYTIPTAGKYRVSAYLATTAVTLTTAQFFDIYVFKNGSDVLSGQTWGNGASINNFVHVSGNISCSAGDTIQIKNIASVSTTASTAQGTSANNFSIERIGS